MSALVKRPRWRPAGAVCSAVVVCALCAACESDKNFINENDRLRARVTELEKQLQAAERRGRELEGRLQQLAGEHAGVSESVLMNTPHLADVTIGRLSHVRDTNGDGRPDVLTVYVNTFDGRGRFIQVTGELSVTASAIPADADVNQPMQIGHVRLDPEQLREAYRSGITGTHYAVDVPIDWPATPNVSSVRITAVLRPGYSDRSLMSERLINVERYINSAMIE